MARWKVNNDGTGYYDAGDQGPDQYQPTDAERAQHPAAPAPAGQQPAPGAQPPAPPANASPWSNSGETWDQTRLRFQNDYHAQDRDAVLGQMNQYRPGAATGSTPAPGASATAPPASNGFVPTAQNAPPGFDQGKWADLTHNSPKYIVGRILAGGGSVQDAARAVGATVIDDDKIQFPDGATYDLFFDNEGQHRVQFTDITAGGAPNQSASPTPAGPWSAPAPGSSTVPGGGLTIQPFRPTAPGVPGGTSGGFESQLTAPAPTAGGNLADELARRNAALYPGGNLADELRRRQGGGGSGTGGGGSSSPAPSAPGAGPGGMPGFTGNPNDLYNTLLQRSQQSLSVNPRDPVIAAQVNAFRAEQERGARNAIDTQAEAQGPNSNLGSERRLASEHAAQATGGLQAQLMGQELAARRQEIQNALSQQGAMMSDERRMALQRELQLLDNALRQQGITNQNSQFYANLGLNAQDRSAYWDAVRSGLL